MCVCVLCVCVCVCVLCVCVCVCVYVRTYVRIYIRTYQIQLLCSTWNKECNIIVLYFVDEEVGGMKGMKLFIELDYFKKLNVGLALDEGILNSYCDNQYD